MYKRRKQKNNYLKTSDSVTVLGSFVSDLLLADIVPFPIGRTEVKWSGAEG